jgi:hypothetical protein
MVKKSNEKFMWFIGGAVIAFVLHNQISGLVDKVKGAVSSNRAAYYTYGVPANVYHAKAPRRGYLRPGFKGQGHAYGRL